MKFDDHDNDALIHTFKQFILLDKDLETAKQDLALRPDFNLLDFFRTFDIEGKSSVNANELEEGMRRYGVFPNREELQLFLRRVDRDCDSKLRFSDFADCFSPKQNEYSSLLHNRTPYK